MLKKKSLLKVIILSFFCPWGRTQAIKRGTCWRRLMTGGVTLPGHMSVISGSAATEERGTTGAPCQRLAAATRRDGWESEGWNRAVSHPRRQVALHGGLKFNMSDEHACVFVFSFAEWRVLLLLPISDVYTCGDAPIIRQPLFMMRLLYSDKLLYFFWHSGIRLRRKRLKLWS